MKQQTEVALEPFDDKSLMFFGVHNGKTLEEVPAEYLMWWYDKNKENKDRLTGDYKRLMDYIVDSMDALRKELPKSDRIWR